MTQEQKDKILGFRQNGMSYTKIAHLTDISVNTIKSFCQRNISAEKPKKIVRTAVRAIDSGNHCRQCGAPLSQIPGHKEKKFCSTSCRMKWWGSHGAEMRHSNPNVTVQPIGLQSMVNKPKIHQFFQRILKIFC